MFDYLAEQLGMRVNDIEQAVPLLEQLGFLERVPMNEQPDSKPKRSRTREKNNSSKTTKKQGKKSVRKKTAKSKNASKRINEATTKGFPESDGLNLIEPESVCPPSRNAKAKDKTKEKWALASPNNNNNGQQEDQSVRTISESKVKAQGKSQEQAGTNAQDQSQAQSQTNQTPTTFADRELAPTTTPPMSMPTCPPIADVGGPKPRVISFAPHASFAHKRSISNTERLSNCITMRGHSREAMEAAARYLDRVGYKPPDDAEMSRELGCFATAYDNLLSEGFGVEAMAWFDREMLKRCDIVCRRPARNRQQYLRKVFENLARDMRRKFHHS